MKPIAEKRIEVLMGFIEWWGVGEEMRARLESVYPRSATPREIIPSLEPEPGPEHFLPPRRPSIRAPAIRLVLPEPAETKRSARVEPTAQERARVAALRAWMSKHEGEAR